MGILLTVRTSTALDSQDHKATGKSVLGTMVVGSGSKRNKRDNIFKGSPASFGVALLVYDFAVEHGIRNLSNASGDAAPTLAQHIGLNISKYV